MQNIKLPFTVQLAGDSIWGYEGPMTVTVTSISVCKDADYTSVEVEHDTDWRIYTDTGFEKAISKKLGYDVTFTEQGMQQDKYASMEGEIEAECDCYGCTTMRHACIDEILAQGLTLPWFGSIVAV